MDPNLLKDLSDHEIRQRLANRGISEDTVNQLLDDREKNQQLILTYMGETI